MANLLVGCLRRVATVWRQVLQCLISWLQFSHWHSAARAFPPDTLSQPRWGRHRNIHVHKLKLHYVENGSSSKPLMLFLHGVPDFWYTWRHQLHEFSQDYWAIALDLPGFGESAEPRHPVTYRLSNMARAVCVLVQALGKTDCILVGHGCGALLGWHIINQYPERVSRYVMLGLPSVGILQELQDRAALPLATLLKLAFLSVSRSLPVKLALAGDCTLFSRALRSFAKPQELEAYKYTFSQPNALARALTVFRENWSDFFEEEYEYRVCKPATVPGLFLVGENDNWIALDEYSTLMTDRYHPLEVRFVPRAGRYPHQEDPKAVNRLMKDFLGPLGGARRIAVRSSVLDEVETKIVVKEVCNNCHTREHIGTDKHEECATNCDGQAHRHHLSKRRIPICS